MVESDENPRGPTAVNEDPDHHPEHDAPEGHHPAQDGYR